jgi:hypothetical protein
MALRVCIATMNQPERLYRDGGSVIVFCEKMIVTCNERYIHRNGTCLNFCFKIRFHLGTCDFIMIVLTSSQVVEHPYPELVLYAAESNELFWWFEYNYSHWELILRRIYCPPPI